MKTRHHLSRRAFLGSAAATVAMASGVSSRARPAVAEGPSTLPAAPVEHQPRANILTLYLAKPVPTWPRPDFDPQDDIRRIGPVLEGIEAKPEPAVRFFGHELLRVPDDLFHLQPTLRQADGLLIFNLTSTVMNLIGPLSETGVPMVLFSQPYSGHDWSEWAALRARGRLVEVIASSDFRDLETPLRVVAARQQMRQSRILCISPQTEHTESSRALEEKFGTPIRFLDYSRLQNLYRVADQEAARRDAAKFTAAALKVVEPKPAEVADSFRLYQAVEKLMEEEHANTITIDCLGGFRRGELPAYPCVAWSKLNDRGLHGVCEGDLETTFTQMLFAYYSGKPGFVSDPVFDTATNTVIHAHCVSATRLDGPQGPAAPFIVRSHMEDNKGVSMQVNMRVGQTVTVAKLADANTLLVSTGRIIATPDLPRGCRTKVATQVKNAARMLENYGGGLHRVLFYGDYLRAAHQMGHLLGLKVVEET